MWRIANTFEVVSTSYRWGKEKKPVAKTFANLWVIFQPLLFGLIGASVTVDALEPETVGECLFVCCCVIDSVVVFFT